MKVTVVKGPLFEEREKEAYKFIREVIMKNARKIQKEQKEKSR